MLPNKPRGVPRVNEGGEEGGGGGVGRGRECVRSGLLKSMVGIEAG